MKFPFKKALRLAAILGFSIAAVGQTQAATCTYSVTNEWNTGFTGSITITNNTAVAINGWTVGWQYSVNRVTSFFNANVVGSNPYSATGLNWNSVIQPGQSVNFGFQGSKNNNSAAEKPSVTGAVCNGGTASSSVSSSSVSLAASSKLSSSVASSAVSSGQQCNWYGNLFPLCANTASGWGWENNKSCLARATCIAQPAPYGIVGATSSVASSIASSRSSSLVSSSRSSSLASISSISSSKSSSSVSKSSVSSASQLLKLSNPNPSVEAVSLFNYLQDQYGKKTLTGQMESTWASDGALHELNFIASVTGGKAPAILGLDYINHLDASYVSGVTQRAADWYLQKNGIPTICWHWGAPTIGQGYDNSKKAFDINKALTAGTAENLAMIRDLDIVAAQLAKLRDKGVPVLWRPFHEFTGTWFWWGMGGSDGFKRLWVYMYNYYTVNKGLNNLIWVLGYSGEPNASYYPGDKYVDVAGADTYVNNHGSLKSLYSRVVSIVGTKRPVALHENGPIPDPDLVAADGANWSFFMTWHTTYLTDGVSNSTSFLNNAYNHSRYITRDELPNLPNYKSSN